MILLLPSILAPLENLLQDGLIGIHRLTHFSWAWSIISLVVVVRLIIFPVTAKQTRSMLAMQRLQPHLKTLQARYKDDRQALNAAMMDFYKDNKVNPMASCLPLLLQLPVFMALFFVLKHFEAPAGSSQDFSFLFGFVDNIRDHINDVGAPGWILLVIYVVSQMISTWTMSNSPDPKQKIMFLFLPLLFVPFILKFPVGLLLYWITTNLWTLFQYLLVLKFTDTTKEVVLPADSKGRKKVVAPKGGSVRSAAGANGTPVNVRKNKRRR